MQCQQGTASPFFFPCFYEVCIYRCELQPLRSLSACSQILGQSIREDVLTHTDFLKPLGSSEESHQDLEREGLIKEDIPSEENRMGIFERRTTPSPQPR